MLIPSIDLLNGQIVQLVHGETPRLAFDDFAPWIERFRHYPLVQLIDLDAAKRQGNNRALIESICKQLPCQVGGGLRTPEDGRALLDAGARRVIYGSSLFSETGVNKPIAASLQQQLGQDQLVFSVDTKAGHIATRGWKDSVALTPEEAITWLEDFCGAFLYTHVDTEGTMQGFPQSVAATLRATTARQLIVAGGIRTQAEIDALDAMGVDTVAGMAIYTGALAT